jgi:hypothetical protein
VIAVAGYSLVTLWVLLIGAAVADRYALGAGYVLVSGFVLGIAFMFAVVEAAPPEDGGVA